MTWPSDLRDPAYVAMVLGAVAAGEFDVSWSTVSSSAAGHVLTARVFTDALKVYGVRVSVSAALEQQIADLLSCMLLTPKLADLRYAQRAVTLYPKPRLIASSAAAMMDEDARITAALSAAGGAPGPGSIVATVGKHWVLDNACLGKTADDGTPAAVNYGWMVPPATASPWEGIAVYPSVTGAAKVIQQPSTHHGVSHVDYSQTCVLADRACIVDGAARDLVDVVRDPVLCQLVSHEGPLQIVRQPAVPMPSVAPQTGAIGRIKGKGRMSLLPIKRGSPPDGWTLPATLHVYAYDLDERQWMLAYQGPTDMADDGTSTIASSVLSDPPAGLGTWAWWYETDAGAQLGPDYAQAPMTTAGKTGPASLRGAA